MVWNDTFLAIASEILNYTVTTLTFNIIVKCSWKSMDGIQILSKGFINESYFEKSSLLLCYMLKYIFMAIKFNIYWSAEYILIILGS